MYRGCNIVQGSVLDPKNGSPTLVEGKVLTYLEANIPLSVYTATRIIKSYPKGFRQDSSNMDPMASWLCGIQCAAMNFQTSGVAMDLNNGLFSINGNVGYVLKPKILLDGLGETFLNISKQLPTTLQIRDISTIR